MGWLLDIVRIAQTKEIKCTRCGNKTVDFVSREGRAYIRCQNCRAETEIEGGIGQLTEDKPKLENE